MFVAPSTMRGNQHLRNQLKGFILPAMADALQYNRGDWGLTEQQLPDPKFFDGDDPFTAGHNSYPNIGIYATGSANFSRTDHTDYRTDQYEYDSELTFYVVAQTAPLGVDEEGVESWEQPYRESAMRQRDDLMATLREVCFRDRSFGTIDNEDLSINMSVTSWRESYDDPIKVSDNRNPQWLASGIALCTVKVSENLQKRYLGNVDTVSTDVTKLA